MLNIIASRSGYGKSYEVKRRIRELLDKNKNDIVVIIPEQISFDTEKELLDFLGANDLQKVDIMSFSRFCEKFFAKYGGRNKPYIDSTGKTAIMEFTLKTLENELDLFKKQATSSKFAQSMLDFSQKLKRCDVSVQKLCDNSAKQKGVLKQKLDESSLILEAYSSALEKDYFDPLDNISIVAKMLEDIKYFNNKQVFFDAFTGFTAQQMTIIEQIIATAENTYFTLSFDGAYSSDGLDTFTNMAKTALSLKEIAKKHNVKIAPDTVLTSSHRFSNEVLEHLEKNIFAPDYICFEDKTDCITIAKAKNIYDEANFVAKTIKKLVRTTDLRYREIAVISRDADTYNGIMDEALRRYDIPCYLDFRRGVKTLSLFKYVDFALKSVMTSFDTDTIIAMLKTGLSDISQEEIDELENYVFLWQINGNDWENDFEGSVDGAGEREYNKEKNAKILERINKNRSYVIENLNSLKFGIRKENASLICKSIFEFVKKTNADKNLQNQVEKLNSLGMVEQADNSLKAYSVFVNILDQLVLALKETPLNKDKFYNLYQGAIETCDIGALPQGLDQVSVGSAERMRPRSPRVTFIIGANDGVFPSAKSGSGLFSDVELQALKDDGISLPFFDIDSAIDEQFLAYTALCTPSEKLYISYSTSSLSGETKYPSQIVETVKSIFKNCNYIEYDNNDITEIASENDAIKLYAQKMKKPDEYCKSVEKYFNEHKSRFFDGVVMALNPTEFMLEPETAQKLYGENLYTSASQIEEYNKCHFRHFCKYGLKAKKIKAVKVDGVQYGNLIHFVLEKSLREYATQEFLSKSMTEIEEILHKYVFEFFDENMEGKRFSKSEEYNNEQIVKDLVPLVKRVFQELEGSQFDFFKSELSFGYDTSDITAYEIEYDKGKKIVLTGSIDRVDIYVDKSCGERYIRIIDYKSYEKSMSYDEVFAGQNLQMLVYMIALKKNGIDILGEFKPSGFFYYIVKDKTLSKKNGETQEELENRHRSEMKMAGALLKEEVSINALVGSAEYSPISNIITKSGFSKKYNYYTIDEFTQLMDCVENIMKKMGLDMQNGNVKVNPVGEKACEYCEYADVCGFESAPQALIKYKTVSEYISSLKDGE